jgi:hypothetical protein
VMKKLGENELGGVIVEMTTQEWKAVLGLIAAYGDYNPAYDRGYGLVAEGVEIGDWLDVLKVFAQSAKALNEALYQIRGLQRKLGVPVEDK